MKVIFDANILCADFRFLGNGFRVLFSSASKIGAELAIPEVAFEEVENKFSEEVRRSLTRFHKDFRNFERLTGQKISLPSYEDTASGYRSYLEHRLSSEHIKRLPYPCSTHQSLVRRALERRHPFREDGNGYRDALIWETILAVMQGSKDDFVFVTQNKRDFFGGADIHPDLLEGIKNIGFPPAQFRLCESLESFNTEFVLPRLAVVKELRASLANEKFDKISIREWAAGELRSLLNDSDLGDTFSPLEHGHGSARVQEIKLIKRIQVDDVRLLPSGDLVVFAAIEGTFTISINIDSGDYALYEDVREWFGNDAENGTWWASMDVGVQGTVGFSLILQNRTFKVLSSEVNYVDSEFVRTSINPHPGYRDSLY